MRRAPVWYILRQFLKESLISAYVGTVVIVLSKFSILTVLSPISSTSPSAPYLGNSTQSPATTIRFAEI